MKDYIARFKRKVSNIEDPFNKSILIAIFVGLLKDGKLYESIYKTTVKNLEKFYERASKEIRWEESFGSKKPARQKEEVGNSSQNKKKNNRNNGREARGEHSNNQVSKWARSVEREE